MDDKFDRIESKLDKIVDHIGSIDSTLAAQHVSLKEHMRRTALLEDQLEPIKRHVSMVQGVAALLGVLAAIAEVLELFKR